MGYVFIVYTHPYILEIMRLRLCDWSLGYVLNWAMSPFIAIKAKLYCQMFRLDPLSPYYLTPFFKHSVSAYAKLLVSCPVSSINFHWKLCRPANSIKELTKASSSTLE